MNIAERKKEKNISEYIIHMYQTEDLIRVYEFDMGQIREYVIKHIPAEAGEKEKISQWYEDIMGKMKQERIEKKGHLKEVQQYVDQLSVLMDDLKDSDDEFKKIYKISQPHIEETIQFSDGKIKQEVQACLNGIYGLLLARMNGRQVPEELMEGINAFGDVLSYLSYFYRNRFQM
ncbi:MAG: DUF4924 family protein [Fulvivirga sp.]